jgi:Las1-like
VNLFTSRDELRKVYRLIYGEKATADDKTQAHQILQMWKVRRSQETLTGVLCTLSLLDVHLKVRN